MTAASLSLCKQLLVREIAGRYRGSLLGMGWALLTPLAMLAVYVFVFGVVFQAHWRSDGPAHDGLIEFSLALFAGLVVFNFFAEVMARAPSLIVSQPNFVKKTVFPLEILPLVATLATMFHALIGLVILLVATALAGKLSFWFLALPLVWAPLALLVLGMAWLLSSLGVFLRDLQLLITPALSALLFLSPVFYAMDRIPEGLRAWAWANPLAVAIESVRALLFGGPLPPAPVLVTHAALACVVAWCGLFWFAKTKKGFADVL
ncbi:MAG: ABC transporter permease [Rhodocyclaceae bacterium]|nr:ABC transporter permease [Rhodocyclaceae bacterium]